MHVIIKQLEAFTFFYRQAANTKISVMVFQKLHGNIHAITPYNIPILQIVHGSIEFIPCYEKYLL